MKKQKAQGFRQLEILIWYDHSDDGVGRESIYFLSLANSL